MADQAQRLKAIADGIERTWQAMRRSAANISGLLAVGKATCDEVRAYNLWALAVYNTQRGMLATLKANGESGVPELPAAPTLFTWKGMSGADAWKVSCDGQPSSLNGLMKRSLRGPDDAATYLSTNEIQIVTTDQYVFQPDQAPSFAQLLTLQNQRAAEDQGQHVNGLGVAWAVVILIAGISVGVGVAIAAIMSYLESSDVQEANVKQVEAQANAFANYTAARLACFQQCTGSGQSTDACVEHCKNIVDKPSILLPGQTGKWGMLQWIGFTVLAGAGTYAAVRLWNRHREGRPVFELPEALSGSLGSLDGMNLWRKVAHPMAGSFSWEHVRAVDDDTADQWLRIFQRDEPNATFELSVTKPKGKRGKKAMRGPGVDY